MALRRLEPQQRRARGQADRFQGARQDQRRLQRVRIALPGLLRQIDRRPAIAAVQALSGEPFEHGGIARVADLGPLERGAAPVRVAVLVARKAQLDLGLAGRGVGCALLGMQGEPLPVVVGPAPGEEDGQVFLRAGVLGIAARRLLQLGHRVREARPGRPRGGSLLARRRQQLLSAGRMRRSRQLGERLVAAVGDAQ